MTQKELKRLRRVDMLEIIVRLTEKNEALVSEVELLKGKLTANSIMLDNAGSIAEAALMLTGVFDAAQRAADIYLESIRLKNLCENGVHV